MKNLFLSAFVLTLVSGCTSRPVHEKSRGVASQDFERQCAVIRVAEGFTINPANNQGDDGVSRHFIMGDIFPGGRNQVRCSFLNESGTPQSIASNAQILTIMLSPIVSQPEPYGPHVAFSIQKGAIPQVTCEEVGPDKWQDWSTSALEIIKSSMKSRLTIEPVDCALWGITKDHPRL